MRDDRQRRQSKPKLHVHWVGGFFTNASLAIVNRRMVQKLRERNNLEITIGTMNVAPEVVPPEFRELAALATAVDGRRPDITVVHEWPPHFAAPSESRYVHIQPWEYGSMPSAWFEALHDECDDLWTHSTYNRNCYIDAGFAAERIARIPHGIDPAVFYPEGARAATDPSLFHFLFVGGTIARKGVDVLLEAYTRAFSASDNVALVVKDANTATFYKGQTLTDALRALAQRPGVPRIQYLDQTVSDENLAQIFRSADCFVLPYRGEGFGLPVLEAMACGVPPIVSDGGATDDFVDQSVGWKIRTVRRELEPNVPPFPTVTTPWLLEPQVDSLVEIMRYAYEHRDEVRARGAAAARRVHTSWTWDQAAAIAEERLLAIGSRAARPANERSARFCDPSTYAERVYGPGELDGIILELFTRIGTVRRAFVEITHGAPPSLALPLSRGLRWTGVVIDSDASSTRILQTRYADESRVRARIAAFTPATIADLLRAENVEPEVDFVSIDCNAAADVWQSLAPFRPRVVASGELSRAVFEQRAEEFGYACVAVDRKRGDALFVRNDLVARAGFTPRSAPQLR